MSQEQDKKVIKSYVTVGDNASIFHDSFSGVTVTKGEVKGLTAFQLGVKRVKQALASGHLIYSEKPSESDASDLKITKTGAKKVQLAELTNRINELVKAEATKEQMVKAFSLKELKELALANDIELEDTDTKLDIINALVDEEADEDDESGE